MSFFALSEVKSISSTTSTFCPEKNKLEEVLYAFVLISFVLCRKIFKLCLQWWYLLFAFLSFLLTRLPLCLLTHSCESLSLLFHRVFISIMTLNIAVCQKLKKTWAKKLNGDRTPRRSALSAAVLGRHHGLQREQKQISTIRINLSPLKLCKYFKENIPNLCPMAQTSRAEVAQCKV